MVIRPKHFRVPKWYNGKWLPYCPKILIVNPSMALGPRELNGSYSLDSRDGHPIYPSVTRKEALVHGAGWLVSHLNKMTGVQGDGGGYAL